MNALAILLVALVADDGVTLASAPYEGAPAQATLHRGDWLEVRGEVPGFLKVWDHRRERPGYVRPTQARVHANTPASAEELRAIVRFLREARGFESLGVAYAALYLKVAPVTPGAALAEVLGALGTMADRLARRASGQGARVEATPALLAAHVEVTESYGVRMRRFERSDRRGPRAITCYDGEAFARVVAMTAAPAPERAQAALALTRRGCLDPLTSAADRRIWNEARLAILDEVAPGKSGFLDLPQPLAHRVRLRTAEALSERAHVAATGGDVARAARAAGEALRLFLLVDRAELAAEDLASHDEAALRVGGVRWLAEAPTPPRAGPRVEIAPASGGQTCVRLWPARAAAPRGGPSVGELGARVLVAAATPAAPLAERCTFGAVLGATLRVAASARALAIAVAPLAGWTELWVFRGDAGGAWRSDVIPPALGTPGDDLGYVEAAGFSPDGDALLAARAFRVAGQPGRRFEVIAADGTRRVSASRPGLIRAFQRADSTWRRTTLALR